MKVMHVLYSVVFTGAETVVAQIIDSFRQVPEMEMCYCSRESAIVAQILAQRNIRYTPVRNLTPKELKVVIDREKPDLIHAHDMRASFISALVCGKIPLVSHIHNNAFDARGLSPKSIAYLLAGFKAKHIIWVSNNAFNGYRFHDLFRDKSVILKNIIGTQQIFERKALDTNTYDFDVIYVGRLTYPKDPERLIRVCARMKQKKQDVIFGIVGTGELEDAVKELAKKLDVEENVRFLGYQTNPMKMVADSKAMVLTSRWEGIPMCALEAMALGVPVISTPVGDMGDLIDNGVNGYLCAEDEEIAESLLKIVLDPAHRAELSENTLKKFALINDENKYREAVEKLYR